MKAIGAGLHPVEFGQPMPVSKLGEVVVVLKGEPPACIMPDPMPPCGWFMTQIVLSPDFDGDGRGEILTVDGLGHLFRYSLLANNTLGPWQFLSGGSWLSTKVYAPGDFDGDGLSDLIGVGSTGKMYLYPGTGKLYHQYPDGGNPLGPKRQIGQGWAGYKVFPVGDLTGDGIADLLAIKESTGELFLYAGNGRGGFKYPYPKVGWGWKGFDLYAAGDVNKDGKADILSIDQNGDLYFYAGRGNGTFAKRVKVGNGWTGYTLAAGADLNGDGLADIVSRDEDGNLFFYAGMGAGQFAKRVRIARGW